MEKNFNLFDAAKVVLKQFFSQYFENGKSWKYKFIEFNIRSDRKLLKQKIEKTEKQICLHLF
jgi:hypothetical protein